ncbi:hypothetical protein JHV675_03950 [Mycobacterium avium subsp. hominissuis]
MKVKAVPHLLLVGAAIAVATPASAVADPAYVGVAVGYQASGAPQGLPHVSSTAVGAQQGAMQDCQARLSACAPAGTSTQCIGVATGVGKQWDSAEGPDKPTAETNARAKLVKVTAGLPLPDTSGDELATTAACSWD